MRFVLSTIGTLGDVLPFVEVAVALRHRGHETVLLVNANFQERVERNRIDFRPLGTREEYLRLAQHEDLYHPLRGVKEISQQWILPGIRKTLDYLASHRRSRETVLVGSTAAVGLRVANELYSLPMHTLVVSPFMLPSVHLTPISPGLSIPGWVPRPLKRIVQSLTDRALDGLLKPGINAIRLENGMAPLSSTVRSWWTSPDSVVGLFPEWFAPVQPDWPKAVTLTNFLALKAQSDVLPPDVENFLEREGRLVVVTMGSILAGNQRILTSIVQACLDGKFKVLLLSSNPFVLASNPSGQLKQLAFAPLGSVLQRASLIIHHAGIGTASAAISAGTPQLLAPQGHDQFDNAARLVRLGVARSLDPGRVLVQIDEILADQKVASSCQRVQRLYTSSVGLDTVCRLLEARAGG